MARIVHIVLVLVLLAFSTRVAHGEPTVTLSVAPGPGLTVEVTLSDLAATPVAGYQVILTYDPSQYAFIAGEYDLSAFGLAIMNPMTGVNGTIILAAGINAFAGQQPVTADVTVATLYFEPSDGSCVPELLIAADSVPPTRLSDAQGQPIVPLELVSIERECIADFDESGTIDVPDIFAFLSAWFAGSCRADTDGGGLGVPDIFTFLSLWFSRCA